MDSFDDLVAIVARLRSEGGCPWDRAQTERTLRPYLTEEAYEVLDAIDRGDDAELTKELGDLLFIVVMIARMAEERGAFAMADVARSVSSKMIDRHPHVFDVNYVAIGGGAGVHEWEHRKTLERLAGSALDGVPDALPALLRAHRISEKASKVGFDWPDRSGVRMKLDEELAELDEALASGDEAAITEEFGDVLFSLVNLGRFLPAGAEDALRGATAKFERRFRAVEDGLRADGVAMNDVGLDELEARWQRVKGKPA